MGNCCSSKPKLQIQQPQNSKKVTERTENEQKIELPLSKHSDQTKPLLQQPQPLNSKISENSKQDLFKMSVELFSLEHQLIYRNTKFSNLYTLMPNMKIVRGTVGKVLVVQHNTTGIIRAAKIIKNQLDKQMTHEVIQKVQALRKLDHPNLVQITDFFIDDQHLYLVTEYCQGGNIHGRIKEINQYKNVDIFNISAIFRQILSALLYLHQKKLLHKNLNPKKVLFTQKLGSLIKLVDYHLFGMSLYKQDDSINDFSYMPPEYFKDQPLYTSASDIWSCGVMLLQTLTGTHPFKDINNDNKKTQRNIMRGTFPQSNEWDQLPVPAKQLIVQMLSFYPKDRPTAKQCLNSKYFTNNKTKFSNSMSFVNVNALRQLKIYNSDSKLRTLFLNIMVDRQMSQNERENLTLVFQKIDTNNDGKISRAELKELLLETMSPEQAQIELDKIFNSLDGNNNGFLDFNEFLVAACDQKAMLNKKNLDEFFNLIDRDKSNNISAKEISKLFCNTAITNAQWKQLMIDADINHDGEISKEEFYHLMQFQRSKI